MLRNSTRQPIVGVPGGLKRTVCQFVDWMFCGRAVSARRRGGERRRARTSKWSFSTSSFWSSISEKTTIGSRMNRYATCFASRSSMPAVPHQHAATPRRARAGHAPLSTSRL
jgi:hypothetical protein